MARVVAAMAILSMAAVILAIATAIEYIDAKTEAKAQMRRYERRCNQAYRENPGAALGSVK